MTNCEVEPLDERRVQCRRVLGVIERFFESPCGSNQLSSFDLHDTIIPARLEDPAVETSWPEHAADDLRIEIKSVRNDKREPQKIHSAPHVTNEDQSVSVASPSDDGRRPETRPDFDRRENPRWLRFRAYESANLVRLELLDGESGDRLVVESTTHLGCPLEPAGDGVPGNPLDPRDPGNADTLDSESDDHIESSSSMLET